MDWLFDGFVSWLAKILATFLDAITLMFSSALGCDLTTFDNVFPFARLAEDIILGLGLSLLFTIIIFQLFRNLWGPLADKSVEHPAALLVRSFVFFPLTFFSKSIVDYIIYLANTPYTLLGNVNAAGTEKWASVITANFGKWTANSLMSLALLTTDPVFPLLIIVFFVLIGWNYIKLLIEVCERYIVIGIISYTAPLAVATGGSKATDQIFKGWCRLVGSQTMLMIFNIWFLKLISSGLNHLGDYMSGPNSNFMIWALLIVAMEKGAQRMDSYMKSIIGNVAITGGGILDDLVATAGAVKSLIKGSSGHVGGLATKSSATTTAGTFGSFAESVGRKFSPSSFAADAAGTGGVRQSSSSAAGAVARGLAGVAFASSLNKGGNFATSVISRIAHGSGSKDYGTMTGETASKSFSHFFTASSVSPSNMNNTTIGNGVAATRVGSDTNIRYFDANKFRAPDVGTYTMAKGADGSDWYKQEFKDTDTNKPRAPERL